MQTKTLGTSSFQVVPLMLGGNVFGWTADAPTSFRILDAFVGRGFNFIDTANVYSTWVPGHQGGESETILGTWFKQSGNRDKVILATKVGMKMSAGQEGLSRHTILEAVEASLTRLQTDHIDLYQSHKDDESTPLDETLETYQQLIQQGKVRLIGASNYTAPRLSAAMELSRTRGLPAYQTLQPEYNLHSRQDFETNLQPVAQKYNLGVVPYFSLASGFLTGKYKSVADAKGANRGSRVVQYFDGRGEKILAALDEVSKATGARPAAISLAWLLAQPTILAPIASATSVSQLEVLFEAVDLKLDPKLLEKLTVASAF